MRRESIRELDEARRHWRAAWRQWLLAWRSFVDAALADLEESDEGRESVARDDLTVIHGIGPTVANRLQEAGVLTYAELASAELEDLADATGRSDARIASEDWIAQAQDLLG